MTIYAPIRIGGRELPKPCRNPVLWLVVRTESECDRILLSGIRAHLGALGPMSFRSPVAPVPFTSGCVGLSVGLSVFRSPLVRAGLQISVHCKVHTPSQGMAFTDVECTAALASAPPTAFNGLAAAACVKWLQYVTGGVSFCLSVL